jgi:hypothetical protein
VLADERGQDLHDRGVVCRRVPGDAFQGIDSSDTHIEPVRAKLLDRFCVAVGHLALPRQAEVKRRVHQCPRGEQARTEGQQAASGGIPGRLQRGGAMRPGDRPDVASGDQVRYGPEHDIHARHRD